MSITIVESTGNLYFPFEFFHRFLF